MVAHINIKGIPAETLGCFVAVNTWRDALQVTDTVNSNTALLIKRRNGLA